MLNATQKMAESLEKIVTERARTEFEAHWNYVQPSPWEKGWWVNED